MAQEVFDKVQLILKEVEGSQISNEEELEQFRIRYLGSKNIIKPLFGEIRNIPNELKKKFGQVVNSVKVAAEEKFQQTKAEME